MAANRDHHINNPRWFGLIAAILVALVLLFTGCSLVKKNSSAPRAAPEAERVLSAQRGLPFQVLIPAYLPRSFLRDKVEIISDKPGPSGEAMIQLIYSMKKGHSLTLSEWIPSDQGVSKEQTNARRCLCACRSSLACNVLGSERDTLGMEVTVGSVRVRVQFSAANILSYEQLQLVLETLGPAVNSQVYSSLKEVPVTYSVPPAVDIPVNAEGVQELTLVVTPDGYTPVHFAVKKGMPVRLIFRQIGQVGCGNELIFQWSEGKSTTLKLASSSDKKVFEFTPNQTGDFRYNCPHLIYRGVMTVRD